MSNITIKNSPQNYFKYICINIYHDNKENFSVWERQHNSWDCTSAINSMGFFYHFYEEIRKSLEESIHYKRPGYKIQPQMEDYVSNKMMIITTIK